LAESAEPHMTGQQQVSWLIRLEREHDNLRAALNAALADGEVWQVLRMAGALWRFWRAHGHASEGRRWLDTALAHGTAKVADSTRYAHARAKALRGAGSLASIQGDYPRAIALLEEGLELNRALGDEAGMAHALSTLGAVATAQNYYAKATAYLEESLVLRRAIEDRRGLAVTLNNLGDIAIHQGEPERAARLLEESLGLFRDVGDRLGESVVLINQAQADLNQGDIEGAGRLFTQSIVLKRDLNDTEGIAWALEGLAAVAEAAGRGLRASCLFAAAAGLRETAGAPIPAMDRAEYERNLATAHKQVDDAAWEHAWSVGRDTPLERMIEYALVDSDRLPGE
jgi:tetratricopeptide (TPR) repeat protein